MGRDPSDLSAETFWIYGASHVACDTCSSLTRVFIACRMQKYLNNNLLEGIASVAICPRPRPSLVLLEEGVSIKQCQSKFCKQMVKANLDRESSLSYPSPFHQNFQHNRVRRDLVSLVFSLYLSFNGCRTGTKPTPGPISGWSA